MLTSSQTSQYLEWVKLVTDCNNNIVANIKGDSSVEDLFVNNLQTFIYFTGEVGILVHFTWYLDENCINYIESLTLKKEERKHIDLNRVNNFKF